MNKRLEVGSRKSKIGSRFRDRVCQADRCGSTSGKEDPSDVDRGPRPTVFPVLSRPRGVGENLSFLGSVRQRVKALTLPPPASSSEASLPVEARDSRSGSRGEPRLHHLRHTRPILDSRRKRKEKENDKIPPMISLTSSPTDPSFGLEDRHKPGSIFQDS
jgi:hypothetical protein